MSGRSPNAGLSNYPTQPRMTPTWASAGTPPVRVRQDLWNAFNSFSTPWVYDPAADLAFRESQLGGALPQMSSDGRPRTDLIRIAPKVDQIVEWMRSFANAQEGSTKENLLSVLQGILPFSSSTMRFAQTPGSGAHGDDSMCSK